MRLYRLLLVRSMEIGKVGFSQYSLAVRVALQNHAALVGIQYALSLKDGRVNVSLPAKGKHLSKEERRRVRDFEGHCKELQGLDVPPLRRAQLAANQTLESYSQDGDGVSCVDGCEQAVR